MAGLVLKADVDEVLRLDHLAAGLGETGFVTVDRRNGEEAWKEEDQGNDDEERRGDKPRPADETEDATGPALAGAGASAVAGESSSASAIGGAGSSPAMSTASAKAGSAGEFSGPSGSGASPSAAGAALASTGRRHRRSFRARYPASLSRVPGNASSGLPSRFSGASLSVSVTSISWENPGGQ
ncbi:MAG: hypothetical protein R3D02_09340 [Hyphomicrobiales bacterium]